MSGLTDLEIISTPALREFRCRCVNSLANGVIYSGPSQEIHHNDFIDLMGGEVDL